MWLERVRRCDVHPVPRPGSELAAVELQRRGVPEWHHGLRGGWQLPGEHLLLERLLYRRHPVVGVAVLLLACHGSSSDGDDAGRRDGVASMDAAFPGTCSSGGAQCANCRDDDGDGL